MFLSLLPYEDRCVHLSSRSGNTLNMSHNPRSCQINQRLFLRQSTFVQVGLILLPLGFSVLVLDALSSVWKTQLTHVYILESNTLDKPSNGFHLIILLPGGLQVLSGIVDIQRGSYFGAIVFIGYKFLFVYLVVRYGMIMIGNGIGLLLESLFSSPDKNFYQFQGPTGIAQEQNITITLERLRFPSAHS